MVVTELVTVFALILANAFFSGAEIAIVALKRGRIQELADQGRGSARAVLALREQPERFLATVQVGITVVGASAAAFGGASLAKRLEPFLVQTQWLRTHAEGIALALVITTVSYLSIVVGELVPKSLALRSAERYALWVSRPLLALSFLARPLVWLLSVSANVLLRPFGDKTTFTETRHSPEEVREIVVEAAQAGTVHPEAAEIATRALDLPELTAADVMVPRRQVIAVPNSATHEELRQLLLEQSKSRLPVYEERIDNVVGYLNVKDLLALAWEQRLIVLHDVIRPAFFVPASRKAVDLLRDMRAKRLPFAMVVDEHGGMAGIVTMEDLLEELVGEIFSEHEQDAIEPVQLQPDGSALVSGVAKIRDVNRMLHVTLPEDGAWSTLAGYVIALAGRMPAVGERFTLDGGVTLEVLDASRKVVRSVLVRPGTKAEAPQVEPG